MADRPPGGPLINTAYNDILVQQLSAYIDTPLTAEGNKALYREVAAGDPAAREKMILGNTALAMTNVESFIRRYPQFAHLRDDLMSAAFIGLTKAVNQMVAGCEIRDSEAWTPVCCMGTWINRELSRLIEDEHQIHLPHESERLAKQKGEPINMPSVSNTIPERGAPASYEEEVEVRDLIDACIETDIERTFMQMREAGYTYAEIADVLQMTVGNLSYVVAKLDCRLQAVLANGGQTSVIVRTTAMKRREKRRATVSPRGAV